MTGRADCSPFGEAGVAVRGAVVVRAMATAVMLLVCLNACSLLDSKAVSGDGQAAGDDHAVAPAGHAAGDRQALESLVYRLIDEQRHYEARLQALEAMVMDGFAAAPSAGHPRPVAAAGSAVSAAQLAHRPIEPDVITRPVAASREMSPAKFVSARDEAGGVSRAPEPAVSQAADSGSGRWVINLGSYSRKRVADRMLAEFRQQDIAAEQVPTLVNEATMYRVRVAGFETRQAAVQQAQSLQERLGIEDVWIARR